MSLSRPILRALQGPLSASWGGRGLLLPGSWASGLSDRTGSNYGFSHPSPHSSKVLVISLAAPGRRFQGSSDPGWASDKHFLIIKSQADRQGHASPDQLTALQPEERGQRGDDKQPLSAACPTAGVFSAVPHYLVLNDNTVAWTQRQHRRLSGPY